MDLTNVVILMPVYRDWASAVVVCRQLDERLSRLPDVRARIVLVDDASPDGLAGWSSDPTRTTPGVTVLRLRTNLGHQRAICVGLCYIYEQLPASWVLVMDSDGEDRPDDAIEMIRLAVNGRTGPIFAARRKRLEGIVFRGGYLLYRWLHRLLTGNSVQAGNFSILPKSTLSRLVTMPELWCHFAGAVFRSRIDYELIPFDRGPRLGGSSHMSLPTLVAHGLAGIASFQEVVAARILIANSILAFVLLLLLAVVVAIRLWTDLAIPGWATYTAGMIGLVSLQVLAISFNLVFVLISNRSRRPFLPIRDYDVFIGSVEEISLAQGSSQ